MHRAAAALGSSYRRIAISLHDLKPNSHGYNNIVVGLPFSENRCCREHGTMLHSAYQGLRNLKQKDYDHFSYGKYSSTKIMQIITALRLGDRSRASSLLLDLSHAKESLQAGDFLDIFDYCASTPDPLFVMETWRFMQVKEIRLNNECHNLMAQALCNGGYLEEASQLICCLEENYQFLETLPLCNIFLDACARVRSCYHANQCLDLMERRMIGKNEVTYSVLLKLAVWQKNLSAVREIWKDYIKHYSLSPIPLLKFIQSFSRLGDLKSAFLSLQHMVSLARDRSDILIKSPKGRLNSSRLDIPIVSKNVSETEKCFVEGDEQLFSSISYKKIGTDAHKVEQLTVCGMGDKGLGNAEVHMLKEYKCILSMKVLRSGFNDLIQASVRAKDYGLAEKLFFQLQNLGLQPSSLTYDGLVNAMVFRGNTHSGMDILQLMQARNLEPLNSTLGALSIGSSRVLELDRAEELLDKVSAPRYPHPFNSFLAACDKRGQPERARQMLAKMNKLKIQPDIVTYQIMFLQLGNINIPYECGGMLPRVNVAKWINALEIDMAKNGIQHSRTSMIYLLRALGAGGMIRELLQYFRIAEDHFCHNDTSLGTPIYNTVLSQLVKNNKIHMAIEVFKNMKFNSVAPDFGTYNIMVNCYGIIGRFKSALALISMMIRGGFYPQASTYAALIKFLLEDESFDEALDLLDQAVSEGYLNIYLYNTILKKAYQKVNIDVIEFLLEHMHQRKIQPDLETIEYVFSAYVECGYHTTAVEALMVLSMRMLCKEDGALKEMMTDLEDVIFSEDLGPKYLIHQFFQSFGEERACALLNLRWCAIMGSQVSWSTIGSPWAKRLMANYNRRKVGA